MTVLVFPSIVLAHESRPSIFSLRSASCQICPVSSPHVLLPSPIELAMDKDGDKVAGTAERTATEDISSEGSSLDLGVAVAVQLHDPSLS